MKIKIKVKTLIKLVVSLVFIAFMLIPFGVSTTAQMIKNQDISEKLYDIVLDMPSFLPKSQDLYEKSRLIMQDYTRATIFQGGPSAWGKPTTREEAMEALTNLEKIINKYPKSQVYSDAYKEILDIYTFIGEPKNLYTWIEWGKEEDDLYIKNVAYLYESYYYLAQRDYKTATSVLDNIKLQEDLSTKQQGLKYAYNFLKANIFMQEGNIPLAKEYYEKAEGASWNNRSWFGSQLSLLFEEMWILNDGILEGDNIISGRVTKDGKGIPFVHISLKTVENLNSYYGEEIFVAITDKDGYYKTPGLKDGTYGVGISIGTNFLYEGLFITENEPIELTKSMEINFKSDVTMTVLSPKNQEIVEDEFTVKWEPVEEASYYKVHGIFFSNGGFIGSNIETIIEDKNNNDKFTDTEAVFSLNKLKERDFGFLGGGVSDMLGFFYDGAEFLIRINAYDENDKMISSSLPRLSYYESRASIKVKSEELDEGQQLIADLKFDEAKKYYKNILKTDENNIEGLEYLAKMSVMDYNNRDIKNGLEYAYKLYLIDGQTEILDYMFRASNREEIVKNIDLFKEVLSSISYESMDINIINQEYYTVLGDYEKAREYAAKYGSFQVLFLDLYLEDIDSAINRIKNDELKIQYFGKDELLEGFEIFKNIDKNSEEYKKFYSHIEERMKNQMYETFRVEDFTNEGIRKIIEVFRQNHYL